MPRCNDLNAPRPPRIEHAGLWLDKFYGVSLGNVDKEVAPRDLLDSAAKVKAPAPYAPFFARWQQGLAGCEAVRRKAEVMGRLIVGLGGSSVTETGITLHRTYGVPVIPGSGLKGLASAYARCFLGPEWKAGTEAHRIMFGGADPESDDADASAARGFVTFFDALYVPGSAEGDRPLARDTMTVHHQEYYNTPGAGHPPADSDDPNPVPFLSATGAYLLALAGPEAWVNAALHILANALLDLGVGGKTSSGYGRMRVDGFEHLWPAAAAVARPAAPQTPERIRLNAKLEGIARVQPRDMRGQARSLYDQWKAFRAPDELRRELAHAILAKIEQTNTQAQFAQQEWYRELVRFAQAGGA